MSWCRAHFGTFDQILLPVGTLLSESCGLVSVGRPHWREDGSAVFSAINQWSESRRTRNQSLLSHLRLSQLGGPDSRIYIPQEQGGLVIPSGNGFLLRRLLRLAGLRWRYSNPPPHLFLSDKIATASCYVGSARTAQNTPLLIVPPLSRSYVSLPIALLLLHT
jgi:hypothetical protein